MSVHLNSIGLSYEEGRSIGGKTQIYVRARKEQCDLIGQARDGELPPEWVASYLGLPEMIMCRFMEIDQLFLLWTDWSQHGDQPLDRWRWRPSR